MDPYLVLAWCFLVFVALLVIGLPSLWWLKSHDVARREKAAPPKVSSRDRANYRELLVSDPIERFEDEGSTTRAGELSRATRINLQ